MTKSQTPKKTTTTKRKATEPATIAPAPAYDRIAYGLEQLSGELAAHFPKIKMFYHGPDGRGTALSVTYTGSDDMEQVFSLLAVVTAVDPRSGSLARTPDGEIIYTLQSNPRTQDSRDIFLTDLVWQEGLIDVEAS